MRAFLSLAKAHCEAAHLPQARAEDTPIITPLYLASDANRPRLRVGVLWDGPRLPRYAATILEDIARSNFADVELAVVLQPKPSSPPPAWGPALTHELYLRVDRAFGDVSDPLDLVDPGVGLAGVDRLEVAAGRAGEPWLTADALAEIRRRDLDVILRFCAAIPRGEVLRAARHGVWSYHFGADEDARGGTPFLQQALEGAPTRDVLLEVLEDEPGAGVVLCRSGFGSEGNLFLAPYRQVALWESTHFVVWKLHDLHALGWEHLLAQAVSRPPRPRLPGLARPPTAGALLGFLAPRVGSAIVNRASGKGRGVTRWQVGLRRGPTAFGSTKESVSLAGFRWIDAPPGRFWADPFFIQHAGKTFLFFEDWDDAKGYATIGAAEVREDCTLGPSVTCLDLGRHLSFPFVFEHQGEVFMLPESLSDGTVTLYRARRFPDAWVPEKVLFRGNAADTTFWEEEGRFYFFSALHDRDDRGLKCVLFTADALTGEWRLHPDNPVSSDARHCRNAGAIFRRGGRLFRPTQNCGPRYGYGLNLEEIVTLSEDRYEERPWCAVDPHALPFPARGIHTYGACGDLEAIDWSAGAGRPVAR